MSYSTVLEVIGNQQLIFYPKIDNQAGIILLEVVSTNMNKNNGSLHYQISQLEVIKKTRNKTTGPLNYQIIQKKVTRKNRKGPFHYQSNKSYRSNQEKW